MKAVIFSVVVLLLGGCNASRNDQCRHYTGWVNAYEACMADDRCSMTGIEYRDYLKAKKKQDQWCVE